MTHTLHPEIENEIKNLFVEFANKHTDCQMFIDLVSKHLGPYLKDRTTRTMTEHMMEAEEKIRQMHEAIKRKDGEITILGNTYRLVDKELPPSQHANIDKIMEDMEQYHITHYLSGRDVVLPCNIRQVLEKHLPPSQHLKDETKQCTACLGHKTHSKYTASKGTIEVNCSRCNGTGLESVYDEKPKTYTFEQMEAEYDRGFTNGLLAIGGKKEELKQSTPEIEKTIQRLVNRIKQDVVTGKEDDVYGLIIGYLGPYLLPPSQHLKDDEPTQNDCYKCGMPCSDIYCGKCGQSQEVILDNK